eukprot:jgi/Mesen1/555/ME000105S10728
MDSIPLGKLNSPFPKQPVGLPFVHGSLHYNSSNLSSRCLPIGENFFLNWCPKKGGILSIQHRSEPERVLWSTVPARAFATAALGEPSVDESRGSFAIHDKVLLTVQHQTVHSIRLVRSKEEKEDGDSSDWEELSDDEAASECEDQEFSSGQGRGEDSGVQMLGKRSRDHNDEPPQPLVPGRRGDTVVISGFLFSDYASAQQKVRRSFRRVSSDALGRRGLGALRPRVLLSRLRNIGGSNAEVAESAAPGGRCELSVKYLLTFAEKSDHTVGFSVRLEQPVVELDELNDDDDDDDDDEEQGEEGEEEKEGGEVIELVKEVDVRVGVEEEHWTPRKRRSIECETSGGVTVQEGERESGAAGTSLPLVTVSSVGSIAAGSLAGAGYGGDGGVSRRHLANRRPSWNWDEDFLEPNAGLLAELRAAPPGTSSPGSTSPTTGADSPELAGAPATQLSGSYSEIISDEDERPGGKPSSLPLGGRSDCVLTDVEIAQALPPTPGSSAKRVRPRWRWWWQYLPATDADSPHLEYSQLSQPPRRGLLGRLRRWRRLAMEGERRSRRRLLRHWLRLGGPLALNRVQLTYASEAKERFFGFGAQFSQFDVKGLRVPVLVQEQGIGRGDQPITFLANVASHMGGGDWHTTYAPVPQYITSEMRCAYLESHEFSVFDLRQRDCVQIQTVAYKSQLGRDMFGEATAKGLTVRNAEGRPYMIENTSFQAAMLDLSNPATRAWFKRVVREMPDDGAQQVSRDVGAAEPRAAAAAEAEAEALPHYEQTARERQEVEEELAEQRAEEDSQLVFFARAGFRGSPRDCTLFWEGDQMVSWQRHDGIKSAVTGLLTSGLSGFAFNHSDVGGYTTVAHALINVRRSEELLLRWMEVNAFTTGNMPEYNMQFYSSDKTLQQFGRFARVYASWEFYRRQLVKVGAPCQLVKLREAAATGMPVVRHLFLHYPKDRQVLKLVYQQFLVGSELLVAPVLDPGHTRVLVYFPPGEEWEHVWTGAKYGSLAGTRGLRVRVPAPLGQPAVFFRTNSRVGLQFRANLKEHGVV